MNTKQTRILKEIESKSMEDVICSWNMDRLFIITTLTLLFQIANLLNKALYYDNKFVYSVLSLTMLCFLFILFLLFIYFSPNLSIKFKRNVYKSYWIIYPLLLTPFYVYNILHDYLPFNLFIVLIVLVTFPISDTRHTILMFISPLVINIALFLFYHTDIVYMIYSFSGILACMVIAINIHGKYTSLLIELSNSCTYDTLTHTLNKNPGYQRSINMFEMCKRNLQPFCVYMLDIDFFKIYNDTFGHQAGDNTLKLIAECISDTFARKQDIVCRYGGEEFLICCTNKELTDFEFMAETLLDNIYDLRIEAGAKTVAPYVTASIGYTVFIPNEKNPYDGLSLDTLIKHADSALYKAKAQGRNRYYKL